MYKNKLFTLIFIFLLNFQYVSAEIISERGEYVLSRDISEKTCFENAKQRALNNAATVLTGEKLKSETIKICEASSFENKAQCELYQSSWSVIDSVTRKGRIKIIDEKKVDKNLYINCEVTIEVDLYRTPKPEPNFDFELDLNQSKFLAGYEWSAEDIPLLVNINPYSNKEMFINVFHWSPYIEGKNVARIFPNPQKEKYDGEINLIKKSTLLPRQNSGYSWKHFFPKGHYTDSISQGILVFASKDNIQFSELYTYEKFQEKLLEVSGNDSRTKKAIYVVIEK